MNFVERNHPAEKMGLWIPKGGTTADEQMAYVQSDKGALADILPLEVTQADIDDGGCLNTDHAVSIAFSRALGYNVATSDGYLYPIEVIGDIEYVDQAMAAGLLWRRNYRCINSLNLWIKHYVRAKNYPDSSWGADPPKPITIDFEGRVNLFGVVFLDIKEGA